jgi:hypothetical protein
MRNWLTFSAVSTLIFALAIMVALKTYRTDLITRFPEPDPQFMPGGAIPSSAYCDWQFALSDSRYCFAESAGDHISLDVNRSSGIIDRTTVSGHGLTIGDLILTWGEPSGYSKSGIAFLVYWRNQSAYITASSLSPRTPIVFISYDLQTPQQLPWAGLINGR